MIIRNFRTIEEANSVDGLIALLRLLDHKNNEKKKYLIRNMLKDYNTESYNNTLFFDVALFNRKIPFDMLISNSGNMFYESAFEYYQTKK